MTNVDPQGDRERALLGEEYWTETLRKEIPYLSLPWANEINAGRATRAIVERRLDEALWASVKRMSSASPFLTATFVVTSFACTIRRFVDADEIAVGISGLDDRAGGTLIFARWPLSEERTFKELYVSVRTSLQQGHRFKELDLERLLDEHECSPKQRCLLRQIGAASFSASPAVRASFDLCLLVDPSSGALGLEFSPERHSPELMTRILECIEMFVRGAVAAPYAKVESIDIVTEDERRSVLDGFNSKRAPLPDTTVPELVQRQATRTPDRIAVEFEGRRLTYRDLNQAGNRIAAFIRRSIPARSIVAVIINRSPEMVAVILGTWKAGCAYLPLDPHAPAARNREVLESAGPALMIVSGLPPERLSALGVRIPVLDLGAERTALERESPDDAAIEIAPGDLAYVIYTSGSTGRPKGAMIEHVGMLNHNLAKIDELSLDAESVVAQNASQCFDISVWQLFSALCTGGKTIIYSQERVLDVDAFLDDVAREVTILELVPSYFRLVLESLERRPRALPAMRMLILNAETLPRSLVEQWFRLYPAIPMINAYGPTEASDDVLHHLMIAPPIPDNVPIGRPIQNINLYVVDRFIRPCPIGAMGEIYISGVGVGRGYLNDPERTAASYGTDPFRAERGRMYRTGDIGRWRPDGSMEFLGRRDHQVKVRGFRVELEEIDKAVMRHPAVEHAAVVEVSDAREQQLHCHFVSRERLSAEALREHLAGLLPDYMVPNHFVEWPRLPLTANGKIDRHALRAHSRGSQAGGAGGRGERMPRCTLPRSELEDRLRQAWAKVLGRPELGITDDFFDAGGDSMKAIRLAAELGGNVLALDIFNHPTIESLARHMASARRDRVLLHLLTGETADPLLSIVGVPNSAGDPLSFRATAEVLAGLNPRCRLYAIALPREPLAKEDTPDSMLEKLVTSVVSEIQAKVTGPLFLFGQCNGSALALATAERLQASGRELLGVGVGGVLPRVRIAYEDDLFRSNWLNSDIMSFLRDLGATMPEDPEDVALFIRDFRYDAGIANTYFNDSNRRVRSGRIVRLRAPVYCFMGDKDPLVQGYANRSPAWHRIAESVRAIEFRDLGHYLLRDQPGQLAGVFDELARLGSTGSPVQKPGVLARFFGR